MPTAPPAAHSVDLPDGYPAWARELADRYFSGTTCLFVLNGNVHDLVPFPEGAPVISAAIGTSSVSTAQASATANHAAERADNYTTLTEFLAGQVFGAWDVVLHYDVSRGLRPLAGSDPQRLQAMVKLLAARFGEIGGWPRDPDQVLQTLDQFIERNLVEDSDARRLRIAIVFSYAQYLVPAGDLATMARGEAARLVRLLSWAQNPYIKRSNVAFCLVADKLSEMNDRLLESPHVATVEIPLPSREERESFVLCTSVGDELKTMTDFTAAELAELSSGLTLVNLDVLLSQAKRSNRRVDGGRFRALKKAMIERQCQGLVEFVEPRHNLDTVVGHEAGKQRLSEDAAWIGRGQLDAAPMGYLICGPVGTGKTFLAECYAGAIGVPCVKLRNFRSKYVGETEGNLEQVLTVLRSLGPVVVIIDEADAALGSRQADGDSGTSSRVFSMIASQMGDTRYRGKIVWMLLTCRPDLLPIDIKRQGRAEVHIPLLYPRDEAEITAMFVAMARKNKVPLAADAIPTVSPERGLSGADIESITLAGKRVALAAQRSDVTRADLEQALSDFIPSAQGLEKELQELAAVLECTQLAFLTPDWKAKVTKPGGRAQMQERFVAIRQLLEQ
jgi:AAA+ superfamily predicted ATPase